ncbi:MAG: Porin precursor [Planctomycetota bacterium]|jgi:porin
MHRIVLSIVALASFPLTACGFPSQLPPSANREVTGERQVAASVSADPGPVLLLPEPQAPQPAASAGLSGAWGGWRERLAQQGVELSLTVTLEGNSVLAGGVRQNTSGHALIDLTGNLDLDRIFGWHDALLSVQGYAIRGHNPSEDAGDFQYFSSTSSGREVTQIAQLFFEQWYSERSLRLKFGKWDGNAEFGFAGNTGKSIHASSVFSPTYFTMPTYPNPATGILAGWVPAEDWTIQAAVMDGAGWTGVNTGSTGPSTFFGAPSDLFAITELAHRWQTEGEALAGGLSLGAWHHSGDFSTTGGGVDSGTMGFYATLDQELSRNDNGAIAGFVQLGLADRDVAPVDLHLGGGIGQIGLGEGHEDDGYGLYASYAHFSTDAGFSESAETAVELYLTWTLREGVILQPDLAYIVNPGGDAGLDNALVFTLRCVLGF